MRVVCVILLILLLNSDWTPIMQGLALLGLVAGFMLYLLVSYKIFRLFGTMFKEQQK
jgi:uncharacterized protein (DUF2062 family)